MMLSNLILGLYILAGKLDDLKKVNPNLELDVFSSLKPKYLDWAVSQLSEGFPANDILLALNYFDKKNGLFKEKDITKYINLNFLEDTIQNLPSSSSRRKERSNTKLSGARKLYEDSDYLLLRITSHKACMEYGNGTKWCITEPTGYHYSQYTESYGVQFYYIINKSSDNSTPLSKIAIALYPNKVYEIYDAKDIKIGPNSVPHFETFMPLILKDSKAGVFNSNLLKDIKRNPDKYVESDNEELRVAAAKVLKNENLLSMVNDSSLAVLAILIRRLDPRALDLLFDNPVFLYSSDLIYRALERNMPCGYVLKLLTLIENSTSFYPKAKEHLSKVAVDHLSVIKYFPYLDEEMQLYLINKLQPDYLSFLLVDNLPLNTRRGLAALLDPKHLYRMLQDENYSVRRIVAQRIDPKYLSELLDDPNSNVRTVATTRVDPKYLPYMLKDNDVAVRLVVAKRISNKYLLDLIHDENIHVRLVVADRLDPKLLSKMLKDHDPAVRHKVALRVDKKYLQSLLKDENSDIRAIARTRLDKE